MQSISVECNPFEERFYTKLYITFKCVPNNTNMCPNKKCVHTYMCFQLKSEARVTISLNNNVGYTQILTNKFCGIQKMKH